jgi:hypothetical protein
MEEVRKKFTAVSSYSYVLAAVLVKPFLCLQFKLNAVALSVMETMDN